MKTVACLLLVAQFLTSSLSAEAPLFIEVGKTYTFATGQMTLSVMVLERHRNGWLKVRNVPSRTDSRSHEYYVNSALLSTVQPLILRD